MTVSNNNKPILKAAILLPVHLHDHHGSNDLEQPLLEKDNSDGDGDEGTTEQVRITKLQQAGNFGIGALLGIAFSVVGFHLLLNEYSLASWSRTQVVLFALAWSSVTGLASYTMFSATHYHVLQTPSSLWERLEYCFALGVFLGFCMACTVTDIQFGLPMSSVFLTLAVAIVWTVFMMAFAASSPDQVETKRPSSTKGTVLPMVMV